jgi:hypothetical protein
VVAHHLGGFFAGALIHVERSRSAPDGGKVDAATIKIDGVPIDRDADYQPFLIAHSEIANPRPSAFCPAAYSPANALLFERLAVSFHWLGFDQFCPQYEDN